ncbi:F0F1 ATP synthase subunit epsilon [Sphingobacterium alkalisoli]|nr:F0F1 ATP synthase subunit epsilon [Sphingobacterium alkalisoli]GGH14387.1 F0F1 ATP synthase subunit epsilon [Sphingobacterium alkalisoli]
MEKTMQLKILLPSRIFAAITHVKRIVAETATGQYGFLPQRLDCTAALVPGILSYETTDADVVYIAIDQGVMVKTGEIVVVSVRNAIGGAHLGKLHEAVDQEFKLLSENEKNVKQVMAKMESSFMLRLLRFQEH